ncbi:MAG: alpha/beta hydrolase [Eubacteriales bacterium]|nr:alpha/beta hydrolase [Eubacteriales bacterium]
MLTESKITLQQTPYVKCATIYSDPDVEPQAHILYFHGGGLLYGSRTDLPQKHLLTLTQKGFIIIAFDYPLAPIAKLGFILEDILSSINRFVSNPDAYTVHKLPYYLWGRSAGAYLCLLAAASGSLAQPPLGILSYYGYGFLTDGWFNTASRYYQTLPPVPESCLNALPQFMHADGPLDTHYSAYVYARQTGCWKSLFYDGREKYFFLDYSLRNCDKLPCPVFCAHSMRDTDIPFAEFQALCQKYHAQRFIASGDQHDFDRNESSPLTSRLLNATLRFLETNLPVAP